MQCTISGEDYIRLQKGETPGSAKTLAAVTVGTERLLSFLKEQYFENYIPKGGSKIKMITGRPGSGKTHFSRLLLLEGEKENYLTVHFSARRVWLHDFREIYLEILRQCDIERILEGCRDRIIREIGYEPETIRPGQTLMDYLSEKGEADVLIRGEIRSCLRTYFTRNSLLDNNFACCCSLLTGSLLGHPVLESAQKELLLAFLHGDKTVKLAQLRALGLSPSRITKYNARHLLRSLAEVAHLGGFAGIMVVIDDMEILQQKASTDPVRYAKVRREDTYESIRQLIDDIDSMRYLMFFLCFDRILLDNENAGMKSYQALWMRVQNEVVSTRFNAFADIIDLDRYADEAYTPEVICKMSQELAAVLSGYTGGSTGASQAAEDIPDEDAHPAVLKMPQLTGADVQNAGYEQPPAGDEMQFAAEGLTLLTQEEAQELIRRAQYGGLGIPYMVNRRVVEGGELHV